MATTQSPYIHDIDTQQFASDVLERSRSLPVVVDFWAAWCGPCRVLGPVLEKLAAQAGGAWELAKVDVDQNQQLAAQFDVRGIPAVKAFRDGQVVDQFEGALPESQVRTWLQKLIPSEADRLADQAAALESDDPTTAERLYRQAIEHDPAHGSSLLGLGRMLAIQADPAAEPVLRAVPAGTPAYAQAQSLLDLLPLLAAQPMPEDGTNPLLQHWHQAAQAARARQWDQALDQLLTIMSRDRAWNNDAARRAFVALLTLLGDADARVPRYRQRLASVVFG